MNRVKIARRLSNAALFVAVLGWVCTPIRAQSHSKPSVDVAPSAFPEAPVGASFDPATGALARPDARVSQTVSGSYRIGADDVLAINVWHEPEVSRTVPVRPDGKISLPLVGDVVAAGMTPTQLQNELDARFSKYLTNPDVSVMVAEIRSQKVNVLGQVQRPGTYPLIPPMNVLDAIAAAGGLREFAKPNKTYILRVLPNGQTERIKFQYKNVLKGKRGSKDMLLQTRDTVVVP